MAEKSSKAITGFDFETQGTLLTRVISEDATGFCHERSITYRKSWHNHDRLNLAFPRGGSTICYKTKSQLEFSIEADQFMVLTANTDHMHWSKTTVWNNFALFPSTELVDELGGTRLLKAHAELATYTRSHLLNDALEKLLHDAVFRKLPENALRPTYLFVLNLVFEEMRAHVALPSKKVTKEEHRDTNELLIYLENKLFENLDSNEIADRMGVSRASLYRNFKNLTGKSIMGYVRHRRMEEARQLMKKGNLKLTDIAQLVGYEDLYTFSTAYKNIFGVSPSKDPSVHVVKDALPARPKSKQAAG